MADYVAVAFLSAILLITTVSFVVMGLRQHRRSMLLGRRANALGLRFDSEDPFDVPRRYGQFALVACGHSPSAHNVTYGQFEGLSIRAFDFRYEIGHGTRRLTRRYGVIVVETPAPVPAVLLWRQTDFGPVRAATADGRVGRWIYSGSGDLARSICDACTGLDEPGACIQARHGTVLFGMCEPRGANPYERRLQEVLRVASLLGKAAGGSVA